MKIQNFLPPASFFRDLKGWVLLRLSLLIAILLLLFWVQRSFSIASWEGKEASDRLIYWDIVSYYSYLPAAFVHGDLTLSFLDEEQKFEDRLYWPHITDDGEKVIKTTMGLSYLYAPFFLIAHGFASISPYEASGFSLPYQLSLAMSAIAYAFLGLLTLRSILRSFYGEWVTGLTLIVLAIGTNLFYYVVDESAMPHSYNFALLAFYLYLLLALFRDPKVWKFFLIGALGGMIVLVRPTNLFPVFLLPLLYAVYDKKSVQDRLAFLRRHPAGISVALGGAFLAILPQLLYWKGVTGDWIYFSYGEERFFFDRPMLTEVLFGYRSGWLLYTPLMSLGLLGLVLFRKEMRQRFFLPILLIVLIKIYLISCWWAWWFGGSFGCRPIVDLYGLLAIPLAATLHRLWSGGWYLRLPLLAALAFFIHLNLYQSWQYKVSIIHWDGMTKEAYWHVFFKGQAPEEGMIDRPEYEAVKKGEAVQ